jgi:TfoX/Sxy family transcriptional regulator of competence genes
VSSTNAKPGADETRVEAGFRDLVEALAGRGGVTLGSGRRGFGSDALLVNGHIFAMVSRGHLVLKLPRERVAALLAEGVGAGFDAGKGTPMSQWVMLDERTEGRWLALAREAAGFVADPRRRS